MMKESLRVAIIIPTMNRADFVIRQLQYYVSVDCPHAIYVGDSSNRENSDKIKNEINNLKNQINITYEHLPALTRGSAEATRHMLSIAKEKYACYSCDDDYQVPNSLTICAEFLENNPDYASAGGYPLNFRTKNNGVYGELDRVSDCPIPEILEENAGDRLVHFFYDNFVPFFLVCRTDQLLKSHDCAIEIKDRILSSELILSALAITAGKSTTLDCLGNIRQMHDKNYGGFSVFEWLISPEWNESYRIFENAVSESISKKDNVPLEDAVKITRRAFPGQLLKWLSGRRNSGHNIIPRNSYFYDKILKPIRLKITGAFPFIKYIYRIKIRQKLYGRKEIHYEVSRRGSPYYKDFKPIVDSFTGAVKDRSS